MADRLNILLVSTQDYIHHPVPSRHHYIFEELALRHRVHVPHFHVSRGNERSTNLHVHNATLFPVRNPLVHYTMNGPYHFVVMNRIIRDEGIDIVVAAHVLAGTAAISAAKRWGVPVIFDLKDWFPESAAGYYKNPIIKETIRRTVLAMTRYNLDNSDHIITVSPSLVTMLKEYGYKAELITNGVDTERFRPMDMREAKKALGIVENTFVIGFVGVIEPWFSLDEVIEAVAELVKEVPDTLFLVVGGGLFTDYYNRLVELTRSFGVEKNVRFTGIVDYRDLPRYIAAMNVCTIPFAKWGDFALPNKFFEYSACGKPILMTPIPDVMSIGGENLFVYHDKEELLSHLKTFYVASVGNFSIEYHTNVGRYSWKSRAERFEEVFNRLI